MTQPIIGPMPLTEAWFQAHNEHVSATSVARIQCGEAFVVYSEMRGDVPRFEGNEHTRRGQRYERPILEEYAETKPAWMANDIPLLIDGDCPSLSATPDAMAKAPDAQETAGLISGFASPNDLDLLLQTWGVEAKFSLSPAISAQLGEEGSDEIPTRWVWQVQSQMAVTGWQYVDVAVLLFGRLKVYKVQRHPTLIDTCRATAVEMMDRVRRGLPPPIDFASTANQDAVKALYGKPVIGQIIDLDAAAEAVWQRRDEHQKAESSAKKSKEAADAEMLTIMANAEMGTFPSGATLRRGTVNVAERVQKSYSYERFWFRAGK